MASLAGNGSVLAPRAWLAGFAVAPKPTLVIGVVGCRDVVVRGMHEKGVVMCVAALKMEGTNGILNVSAVEKGSGSTHKITITNDKKMSKEEIEKLIEESEKFKEADEKNKERIESKNELENTLYSLKSQEFPNNKDQIMNIISETLSWLDENQHADKNEYLDKLTFVKDEVQKLSQESSTPIPNPGPETVDID